MVDAIAQQGTEAERRVWFLLEASRHGEAIPEPVLASADCRGAVFRCIIMNGAKPGAF
jgi:hypothetical protein